jgi:hypothetical protein
MIGLAVPSFHWSRAYFRKTDLTVFLVILATISQLPLAAATFDYVIVGGGATGLSLAVRLSEDPMKSVAVLEAGGTYVYLHGIQCLPLLIAPRISGVSESEPLRKAPQLCFRFNVEPIKH